MERSKNSENPCRVFDVFETVNSKYVVFIVISERDIKGELIWAYIYYGFWDREILVVKKALHVKQKSSVISQAANLGYEIPALLYSLLKPTRTLIAKAIGREKSNECELHLDVSGRQSLSQRRPPTWRRPATPQVNILLTLLKGAPAPYTEKILCKIWKFYMAVWALNVK